MGWGKGFWPSLWFVQGILEVVYKPVSSIAWIFLAVATVYWVMKLFQNQLSGIMGHVLTVLTAMLWIISFFVMF